MRKDLEEEILDLYPWVEQRCTEISKDDFTDWLNQHPEYDEGKGGIRRQNIYELLKDLEELYNSIEKKEPLKEGTRLAHPITIRRIITTTKKFRKATNAYLKIGDENNGQTAGTVAGKTTTTHASKANDELTGKSWHFYFLTIKVGATKHAELARAVLTTKPGGQAEMKHINDGIRNNYTGYYKFLKSGDVVYFNLNNKDNTRQLHLKIMFDSPDDEIILGSFTTYDQRRLFSCRALLESIDGEQVTEQPPKILSYRRDGKGLRGIKMPIKNYLGLKKHNYQVVPKDDESPISTLDRLDHFIKNTSPFEEKENSFLDYARPILFMATPKGAQDNSLAIDPYDEDKNKLIDNLEKKFPQLKILQNHREGANSAKLNSCDMLKLLRRTRFFVLVLTTELSKASFSLVQLGWALAHCKHVMVVYGEDLVTENFREMRGLEVEKYKYPNDFKTDLKKVQKRIELFVDGALDLPGKMPGHLIHSD